VPPPGRFESSLENAFFSRSTNIAGDRAVPTSSHEKGFEKGDLLRKSLSNIEDVVDATTWALSLLGIRLFFLKESGDVEEVAFRPGAEDDERFPMFLQSS
jgi:hypothetical protein